MSEALPVNNGLNLDFFLLKTYLALIPKQEKIPKTEIRELGYKFIETKQILPGCCVALIDGSTRPEEVGSFAADLERSDIDLSGNLTIMFIDGAYKGEGIPETYEYHAKTKCNDPVTIRVNIFDHHGNDRKEHMASIQQTNNFYDSLGWNEQQRDRVINGQVVYVINDIDTDSAGSVVVGLIHTMINLHKNSRLVGELVETLKTHLNGSSDYILNNQADFLNSIAYLINLIGQTDVDLGVSRATDDLRKFQAMFFKLAQTYQQEILNKDIRSELKIDFFFKLIEILISYAKNTYLKKYATELAEIKLNYDYIKLYSHKDFIFIDEFSSDEKGKKVTGSEHREKLVNDKIARIAINIRDMDSDGQRIYYSIVVLKWNDDDFGYKKACFQSKLITELLNKIEAGLGTGGYWYGSSVGGTRDQRSNIAQDQLVLILKEIIPVIMEATSIIENGNDLITAESDYQIILDNIIQKLSPNMSEILLSGYTPISVMLAMLYSDLVLTMGLD